MGFVVDKVSEDSFYENLLLGLNRVLEKSPCVTNLNLKRLCGVRQVDVRSWEHNNGVILPEDLRAFYSSSDGFLYTYDFSYDYFPQTEETRDTRRGIIAVNPINELVRVYDYEMKTVAQVEAIGKSYRLSLSRDSKVFALGPVDEYAKVVLVYLTSYSVPNIWLCCDNCNFFYLADDFTTYFRMCVAHLGIPCWQYCVTKEGLPEWSKEIFNVIAPGVLHEDRNIVDTIKYNLDHVNKIDPNIFATQHGNNEKGGATVKTVEQQSKNKEKKTKGFGKRSLSGRSKK